MIKLNKKELNALHQAYLTGKTQQQLGLLYKVSAGTIRNILLKTQTVPLRPKGFLTPANVLNLDRNYFEIINTEQKAYWLGVLCADGCIQKTSPDCIYPNKVTLVTKDYDWIQQFKKDIASEHTIRHNITFDERTNKTYKSYTIQITSKVFTQHLLALGVTPNKTNVLSFPNIPKLLHRHFIRGLFDGDGCISFTNKNHRLRASLISTKEVLQSIQQIMYKTLKIPPTKLQRVTNNKTNVYKLLVYHKVYSFLKYIYNDCNIFLYRKFNLFKSVVAEDYVVHKTGPKLKVPPNTL